MKKEREGSDRSVPGDGEKIEKEEVKVKVLKKEIKACDDKVREEKREKEEKESQVEVLKKEIEILKNGNQDT